MTHELWARFILTLGALVVVPLALRVVRHSAGSCGQLAIGTPWGGVGQVLCALLLGVSQLLSPGIVAAAFAVPWAVTTGIIATAGLVHAWSFRRGPIAELASACGMIYLAVGGGWVLIERAGIRPLNFDPAIILLTGIHFHYAGFALPILAGLAIGSESAAMARIWKYVIAIGVVASVPLVAVGITASQLGWSPWLEVIAAWCMSLAGMGVAWLYLRLAFAPATNRVARQLWSIGAIFLAAGMCLSLLYGSRFFIELPWLDIPTMRAWHGTANALGFTVPAVLGWRWNCER